MSGQFSIIESKLRTSVKINDFYVTANSITEALVSYTDPALFHTEGMGEFHLSKSGSLFRIVCENRYFALVCAHQVQGKSSGYDHDQICLHNRNGRVTTSHAAYFAEENSDFHYDAILYEFTDIVVRGNLPNNIWFRVNRSELKKDCPKPELVFAIGYPGYRNAVDYEKSQYQMAPNAVSGVESLPSVADRLAFRPKPKITFDPSGMSGSPAFGLWIPNEQPEIYFAGLLTEASRELFHFLPRNRLLQLIDHAFA